MKNIVFFNGHFLPYEKASIPLSTHALHYGTGCFEGIRGYWSKEKKRLYVFRMKDHYKRLEKSCQTLLMKMPWEVDKLCSLTIELLRRNRYHQDVYIRPIVYKSSPLITEFNLRKLEDGFAIYTTPLGHYLDVSRGIKVRISSWQRVDQKMIPPQAKPTGIYLNTCLAKTEAEDKNFDEAIFQNPDGSVAEGSAENIFLVKNKELITPSTSENILEGITRNTIIELARKEFGLGVRQRKVLKNELYEAEEVFLTGTGAEVTPVIQVDKKKIGQGRVGPVTQRLQLLYFQIVRGENPKYLRWLTSVDF